MKISDERLDQFVNYAGMCNISCEVKDALAELITLRAKSIEDDRELAIWRNEDIPCPHQIAQEEKLAAFRLEVFEEAAKALDTISVYGDRGKYSSEVVNYGIKVSADAIRKMAASWRDEFLRKCLTCGKNPCECKDDPDVGYFSEGGRGLDDGPPNSIIKY